MITAPVRNTPFRYAEVSTSATVPFPFPVAIAGHGYMIDFQHDLNGFRGAYARVLSVPVLRAQADQSNLPGQGSINPEGLWRRYVQSWHLGAGQTYTDRPTSDGNRFHSSKGVDPWTPWQLSLLPGVTLARPSTNVMKAVTVGSYLYVLDGGNLLYTTDPNLGSFTAVTDLPGTTIADVATNGFDVWISVPGSGLWHTTRGATGVDINPYTSVWGTAVGFVKGRLMLGQANLLYNITAAGGSTPLFTHPNADFTWVGFAEGQSVLYAAGYSGTRSTIYRTAVKSDGTALDAPIEAASLPVGETVRSIVGYLGLVVIGTDLGVRFAIPDSTGDLQIGSLIPTTGAVQCLEGQSRFVWFGWPNYDTLSSGLGRLDLSNFTAPETPAYASDLMATGTAAAPVAGAVTSVATFAGRKVFTVTGFGLYQQTASYVPAGTMTAGKTAFGISDDKVAINYSVHHEPLAGSVAATMSTDDGPGMVLGANTTPGTTTSSFPAWQSRGRTFEATMTLGASADPTRAPVVAETLLKAYPAPTRTATIIMPLLLHSTVETESGTLWDYDVSAELAFLSDLQNTQRLVPFQIGDAAYTGYVADTEFVLVSRTPDQDDFNGTVVVQMKAVG